MKHPIFHLILITAAMLSACSTGSSASPTPTLDALQEQGYAVYKLRCAQCHALDANTTVIGPSLAGIATRAGSRVSGYDAQAYIETSILSPKSYLVDGYADTMPTNFSKELTSEEFSAVVAFLMSQK